MNEDFKRLSTGFDISTHRLLNFIIAGLQQRIADETGLKLEAVGKTVSGNVIKVDLIGQSILTNDSDAEDLAGKVDTLMNSLKNPNELLNMVNNASA